MRELDGSTGYRDVDFASLLLLAKMKLLSGRDATLVGDGAPIRERNLLEVVQEPKRYAEQVQL